MCRGAGKKVFQAALLVMACLLFPSLAGASTNHLLRVRLDAGAEEPPQKVCITAHNISFDPSTLRPLDLEEGRKHTDEPSGLKESLTICTSGSGNPLILMLDFFPPAGKPILSGMTLNNGLLAITYLPQSVPATITVTVLQSDGYHAQASTNWTPALGTLPVPLAVVPKQVTRALAVPEYDCLEGEKSAAAKYHFSIESDWTLANEESIPVCSHSSPRNPELIVPAGRSLRDRVAVEVKIKRFSFAWKPDCLCEAKKRDGGVQLVSADQAFHCAPASWKPSADSDGQYEWACSTANALDVTFPSRVHLQTPDCNGKPCPAWDIVVQRPGQVVEGYLPDEQRTLLVKWMSWGNRARWRADEIERVRLRSSYGNSAALPPSKAEGEDWTRVPWPGLQCGEIISVTYDGDRRFREQSKTVGKEEGLLLSSNAISIAPPKGDDRIDGVTLGGRVGGGLGRVAPIGPNDYWSPFGEIAIYLLDRGNEPTSWHQRGDWEFGLYASTQRWVSYAQIQEFGTTSRHAAGTFGADVGRRWSLSNDIFWGFSGSAAWVTAMVRHRMNGIPEHPNFGGRLSLGYFFSSAFAIEPAIRFMLLGKTLTTKFDEGGLVESSEKWTPTGSLGLYLRFDDLQ
jgi:hypothetical protein